MPNKMSREDFYRWHRRRMRWILFLDTSEAFLMLVTILWGAYLIVIQQVGVLDSVSLSLVQAWPRVPLWAHGMALMGVGSVHAVAMRYNWRGHRRWMIMAQLVWFSYDEYALWFAHVYPPFIVLFLAYVLACIVNYCSLLKPPVPSGRQDRTCQPDK